MTKVPKRIRIDDPLPSEIERRRGIYHTDMGINEFISTELVKQLVEAVELIQGYNWQLDDSPHGQEIKRRAESALAAIKETEDV